MRSWILGVVCLVIVPITAVDSATQPDLRPFVRGSWQELRGMHAGQATVVHFWGLTCGPCLVEMPSWTKLRNERPDLNLVLIDANPFGDDPASVWTTLTQQRLSSVENWIFADRFEEKLRFEIDPHWHGEMPYTVMIGPDGTVSSVTGVVDFAKLTAWLDIQKSARP